MVPETQSRGRKEAGSTSPPAWSRLPLAWAVAVALILGVAGVSGIAAQDQPPAQAQAAHAEAAPLRGIVRNAVSGDPLPRALVEIEGNAADAVLTDGDGRFEFPDVPAGPQLIQLTKPGFRDQAGPQGQAAGQDLPSLDMPMHNVWVAPGMQELVFTMTPTNAIEGRVDLSSGDTAMGMGLLLLQRTVQDGRAIWRPMARATVKFEGRYRFPGLADGFYIVATEPTMENQSAADFVSANAAAPIARTGFRQLFYPGARAMAQASPLQLSGGQTVQANLDLDAEVFEPVRITVLSPEMVTANGGGLGVTVMDAEGNALPYIARYDAIHRMVEANLPDGTYVLEVSSADIRVGDKLVGSGWFAPLAGRVEFTVAGQPLTNLRVGLARQATNRISVAIDHRSNGSGVMTQSGGGVSVVASRTGGIMGQGIWAEYATGPPQASLSTTFLSPGTYWIGSSINQPGLCEESFTAGGASLGSEPLTIGEGGTTAPMTLTLRDDCASVKLRLPPALANPGVGEEKPLTVYLVPDFDSTSVKAAAYTLRATSGGEITVPDLTPGNYHVYAFSYPVDLEYRNREALRPLTGQAVTVEPGTNEVVVEAPAP